MKEGEGELLPWNLDFPARTTVFSIIPHLPTSYLQYLYFLLPPATLGHLLLLLLLLLYLLHPLPKLPHPQEHSISFTMKFTLARVLVLALAADTAVAASWFTSTRTSTSLMLLISPIASFANGVKTAYNKWHETELERWLSDHDIPYPTASDRKNLENLVKDNWQSVFTTPYANWDTGRLQKYLQQQGTEVKKGAENNKDALVAQVKSVWQDADSEAHSTYSDVKDWIFNS